LDSLSISELRELKKAIFEALDELEDELIIFPIDEQDIRYFELINKAIYFRTMIEKIDDLLKKRLNK
jgi:CRISPR/Cas system-associated endoribonuclease Cas2